MKGKNQKGQVSVELMVVLAFAFLLIGGTSYYFMGFLSSSEEDIAISQAEMSEKSTFVY